MAASDGFSDVFYTSADGLKLHARVYGEQIDGQTPVVCLPGLTRNVRDFHELAVFLSRKAAVPRKVVAFDYRGRGASAYDPNWKNYDVVVEAGDVADGLTVLGISRAHFIGTSRGGIIIHVLAVTRPTVLGAVVLNDVGPVLEGEGLAHIRSYLERTPKPRTLAEAVDVQRAIHGQAFPALSDADWVRFMSAIYREVRGAPAPDFDPALLNILQRFDLDRPLPAMWQQFEGLRASPLLAIRGANSRLLTAATLAEMAKRHPDCETITVEGQGHAPLLETGTLPQQIAAFLDRADGL